VALEHEKLRKWAAKGYRLQRLLPRFKSRALEQKFVASGSSMLAQRRGLTAGCIFHLASCVYQWRVRQREVGERHFRQGLGSGTSGRKIFRQEKLTSLSRSLALASLSLSLALSLSRFSLALSLSRARSLSCSLSLSPRVRALASLVLSLSPSLSPSLSLSSRLSRIPTTAPTTSLPTATRSSSSAST